MFLLFVNNNNENRHKMNDHEQSKIFFFSKFKTNINIRERFHHDFFDNI